MPKRSSPILDLAITITCTVVPIVLDKAKAARKEKKRLKDGNIFVLKPEIRI